MSRDKYSEDFYRSNRESVRRSAEAIVPLVLNLVRAESVVDVGCALGTWLSVFREHGAKTILGIDGDWVPRGSLEIPSENFMASDLARPLRLARTFDLVVCLEVAEHLPPNSAGTLVDSLTRLGPVILFSAAIPNQGGTRHRNEQWPTYWADMFAARGYQVVDSIRGRVWDNDSVASWYAQNTLLFVRKDVLQANPAINDESTRGTKGTLSLVHPRLFLSVTDPWNMTPGGLLRSLRKTFGVLLAKTLLRRSK